MNFLRSLNWRLAPLEILAIFLACLITFPRPTLAVASFCMTLAFVLVGTVFAFQNKKTAIAATAGLVLYAASWPIVHAVGLHFGVFVWSVGVLTWFYAFSTNVQTMWMEASTIRVM